MSLAAFVLRRLLWAIPVLLFVMLLTFLLMRAAGGSPFQPPEGVPGLPAPLQREMTEFYNLDEPWPVEFATYVKHVVTLDFGPSLVNRYRSVDDAVEQGFPTTGQLVLLAAAWAIPVGLLLGLFAVVRRGSALDHLATSTASVLLAVPVFFVTYVLSRYLVLEWHVFPLEWETWQGKVLPVFALGLAPAGYVARLTERLPWSRPSSPTTSARRRRRGFGAAAYRPPRPPKSCRAHSVCDAADARAAHHRRPLFLDGLRRARCLERVPAGLAREGLSDDPWPDRRAHGARPRRQSRGRRADGDSRSENSRGLGMSGRRRMAGAFLRNPTACLGSRRRPARGRLLRSCPGTLAGRN